MANINSYYLYQKYEKRGDQPWIAVYPSVYSVDGDGTMPIVMKEERDQSCPEPQYRTIATGTTCNNANKYVLNEYQVSYDNGATWTTNYSSIGSLIESDSYECGFRTGTTTSDTYCSGDDLYADIYYRTSRNGGATWATASTTPTLVEAGGCATPLIDGMYQFTLDDSSIVTSACNSTSAITSGQVQTYRTRIVSVIIGNCVTTINDTAFNNCHYITSMTIPNSVTVIGGVALSCQGLKRLNSDVDGVFNLPNHVTSIGTAAFEYCYGLTSIDIPSGVTSISDSTFFGCRNLTSVTIPSGVTNIYGNAFRQCYNLTSVTCLPTTPPTLGNNVFEVTSSNMVIYVPAASVSAYQSAWSDFASKIQAIPS